MHHVKPLTSLTAEEIRDLARAAADRGEDHADANPFDPQGAPHSHVAFVQAFHARTRELEPA